MSRSGISSFDEFLVLCICINTILIKYLRIRVYYKQYIGDTFRTYDICIYVIMPVDVK